jgi:sec-independent protein translocase protein TatB
MFNLGPFELVAIFVVALLVFGPDKLPEMGKQVGRAVKEFKKFQTSMQTQVRDVIEPITGPMMSNGPLPMQPTNIKGVIPTEMPPNDPRSATIQNPDAPEGEEAAPAGTFGHYTPVEPPASPVESAAPGPDAVSPGDTPEAPSAPAESASPADSAEPDSR